MIRAVKFRDYLKKFAILTLITLGLFSSVSPALADEYTIEGNGDGSQNNINVTQTQSTPIVQSNNQTTQNDVNQDLNTGGNSTSDGTGGESGIQTGAISSETIVENQGNVSVAEVGCCPNNGSGQTEINILSNGSDSDNSVDYSSDTQTNVYINQNATITTNVTGNLNTGNNEANDNSGNVTINTGSIKVTGGIINKNINFAVVKGAQSVEGFLMAVSGNGSGSNNNFSVTNNSKFNHYVNNVANIINHLDFTTNTGGNKANGNIGTVSITTGDVLVDLFIKNDGINTSIVDISCCKDTPGENPPPDCTKNCGGGPGDNGGGGGGSSSSSGGGSSSGSGSGGSGSVLGASTGPVLPETGGASLWMVTALALLMLSIGLYLRFYETKKVKFPSGIFFKFAFTR